MKEIINGVLEIYLKNVRYVSKKVKKSKYNTKNSGYSIQYPNIQETAQPKCTIECIVV